MSVIIRIFRWLSFLLQNGRVLQKENHNILVITANVDTISQVTKKQEKKIACQICKSTGRVPKKSKTRKIEDPEYIISNCVICNGTGKITALVNRVSTSTVTTGLRKIHTKQTGKSHQTLIPLCESKLIACDQHEDCSIDQGIHCSFYSEVLSNFKAELKKLKNISKIVSPLTYCKTLIFFQKFRVHIIPIISLKMKSLTDRAELDIMGFNHKLTVVER